VFQQDQSSSNPDQAARRKAAAAEHRTVIPATQMKSIRKRRKLPVAMLPYIKPRRKRRMLTTDVTLPCSSGTKLTEGISVKSSREKKIPGVKPVNSEVTGQFTSAGIVSRYRNLDQQRSQTRRRTSDRTVPSSLAENGLPRPSTRSQTAAIMHRQLVMARMKAYNEEPTIEHELPRHLVGGTPLSKTGAPTTVSSKHTRGDLSSKLQTSSQHAALEKRSSSESAAKRPTADVKKQVSDCEDNERSMRRFIRRRNVQTLDANKGSSLTILEYLHSFSRSCLKK